MYGLITRGPTNRPPHFMFGLYVPDNLAQSNFQRQDKQEAAKASHGQVRGLMTMVMEQ